VCSWCALRWVEWHFDMATERNGKAQTVTDARVMNDSATAMKGTVAIAHMRGDFTAEH
jgi:hypothetical protein